MNFRDAVFLCVLSAVAIGVILNKGQIPIPNGLQSFMVSVERLLSGIDVLKGHDSGSDESLAVSPGNIMNPSSEMVGQLAEAIPQFHCRPPQKKAIGQASVTRVYKWIDDQGRVHYGDKLPALKVPAQTLQLDGRLQYFRLNLHTNSKAFPPHFQDRLTVRVEKAYQVLAQLIPDSLLGQVDVNLWVFDSRQDYEVFQRKHAPTVAAASQGFHNSENNIAAAWRSSDEQIIATSVHESVHVMNAGMFGHLPRWLNEGMAEYIEGIHVYGQAADITVADDWLQRLQGKRLRFDDLFRADDAQWQGGMRLDLYAHSWGLVYFLMSSEPGREILGEILVSAAKNPCQLLNGKDFLQRRYPGGLSGLESQFDRWLGGSKSAHRL